MGNPIKNIAFNFIYKIPFKFSKNHKLETIFEKNHRSSVILKIGGATPQLVQNLTPIRKLLCTFLYLCCYYPRPPFNISKNKKNSRPKNFFTFTFTSQARKEEV